MIIRRKNKNRPQKGSDTLVKITLDFEEAVFGCKKDLKLDLDEECEECSGKGGFDEKTCPECGGNHIQRLRRVTGLSKSLRNAPQLS